MWSVLLYEQVWHTLTTKLQRCFVLFRFHAAAASEGVRSCFVLHNRGATTSHLLLAAPFCPHKKNKCVRWTWIDVDCCKKPHIVCNKRVQCCDHISSYKSVLHVRFETQLNNSEKLGRTITLDATLNAQLGWYVTSPMCFQCTISVLQVLLFCNKMIKMDPIRLLVWRFSWTKM